MSDEARYITVFPVPEREQEARYLLGSIRDTDPTFKWLITDIDGERKLLIYSKGKNQAKMRGEWLRRNTELFSELEYETTHDLTLKTILKDKPEKVMGMREMLKRDKRDKIWRSTEHKGERTK